MPSILFGAPNLVLTLPATGQARPFAFGTPGIVLTLPITGAAQATAFGTPGIVRTLPATGAQQAIAFGAPGIVLTVPAVGFADSIGFGTPGIVLTIPATGFASAAAFGTPGIVLSLPASGFADSLGFGTPGVEITLTIGGFAKAAAFGTPGFVDTASAAIPPDAIAASTNLTGAVTDIDEDPDSPDANWLTATSATAATDLRVTFGTPPGDPFGAQNFRYLLRKTTGAPNPTFTAELRQNNTLRKTLSTGTPVTSTTGTVFQGSWDASDLRVTQVVAGVYRWEIYDHSNNISLFSTWLGKDVTLAAGFEASDTWDNIAGPAWQMESWGPWVTAQSGRKLILAVPMLTDTGSTLAGIIAGTYDTYWEQLADNLVANGLDQSILRLGWEFNGDWFTWAASGVESTFISAWRHIVDTIRAKQPTAQLKFAWCQNLDYDALNYDAYPGDDYVDYVTCDVYDQSWVTDSYPYPDPCDAACHTLRQGNAWDYISSGLESVLAFAISHDKKMGIDEWGIFERSDGHGGLDNPSFIQNIYDFITTNAQHIEYHVYFDVVAADGDHQLSPGDDSHVTQFPDSSTLFKSLFADDILAGTGLLDGSDVECRIVSTVGGATNTVEIGAIEWNCQYVTGGLILTPSGLAIPAAFGGQIIISPAGFAVALAVGAPSMELTLPATGVQQSVSFGAPGVVLTLPIAGAAQAIAFGTIAIAAPIGSAISLQVGATAAIASVGSAVSLQVGAPELQITGLIEATGLAVPSVYGLHPAVVPFSYAIGQNYGAPVVSAPVTSVAQPETTTQLAGLGLARWSLDQLIEHWHNLQKRRKREEKRLEKVAEAAKEVRQEVDESNFADIRASIVRLERLAETLVANIEWICTEQSRVQNVIAAHREMVRFGDEFRKLSAENKRELARIERAYECSLMIDDEESILMLM